MITKAKVSLASVKAFCLAAVDAENYSSKFDKGIACLKQMLSCLTELRTGLEEKVSSMQVAQKKLATKIKSIKESIAKLIAQLNELQNQLSDLENELSRMDSSFTMTNEEGEEYQVPNPTYVALEANIFTLKSEINVIEAELYSNQHRLDKANSVDSQLLSHIDAVNSVICSLEEKKKTCKQLMLEMDDVKNSNLRKSVGVVENLKKIEQIIAGYLRTKMNYDSPTISNSSDPLHGTSGINININLNRTTVVNEPVNVQNVGIESPVFKKEYIKKHQIKFDANNHICEYEGRKYGGKYNSYDERIKRTSENNPILGKYVGDRGESKYIPSNRSAEGIKVIKILSKYGLDGIEYRNGEPDFEVCSEAIVTIKAMTEYRYNYIDVNGVCQLGNFSQADIELAKLWNFEERDGRKIWEARDVYDYRKTNGFSWHEKCDTETMVLVKTEINDYFKHKGGCSECRRRDAGGNEGGGFDE